MTDKQTEALRLAALIEKTGARGSLRDQAAVELRRQHAENETLRTGYEAARLEIESLKAQQPGAAGLIGALKDAQQAINSMKVEAETAAQGDEQMMLEACETISNEGLQADTAIRVALASHGQAPAGAQKPGAAYAVLPDIDEDDGLIWQAIFDWKDCEPECIDCRRRIPGWPNDHLLTHMDPPAFVDGKCPMRIEP